MIAALFVEAGGCYFGLPDVDPWDESRDARLYAGPHPVVAHPPCQRWSQLAKVVEARWGHKRGDDGGCFASALASVRKWGGVLEHPALSEAWRAFDLLTPPHSGAWVNADFLGGWTCNVSQGRYGHLAPKATWLFAAGVDTPSLNWGSIHTGVVVRRWRGAKSKEMPKHLRSTTPLPFRDLLLGIARTAKRRAP